MEYFVFNMLSTFKISVFFRHDISVFNILSTFMISVFFRHNISVFYMLSTFMTSVCFKHDTSVFFRPDIYIDDITGFSHDIYIYEISVFLMISNENHFIYRWMSKTTNSFHNRSVTFLQLYKKWWEYHNWSFCPCELK